MAIRPVFSPCPTGPSLYSKIDIDFKWHPGFSTQQKQKSVQSLHREAIKEGFEPLLEVSTKSRSPLGNRLSAFNLLVSKSPEITVESAYQGSKVFEDGGPYRDLYTKNSGEAKTDDRLRSSGELVGFDLNGQTWPLNPKTVFYDWLYLKALQQHVGLIEELLPYEGFTDIEFNPEKSISCQARAAAIGVSLFERGLFSEALRSKQTFLTLRKNGTEDIGRTSDSEKNTAGSPNQGNLFD